jgi:hypothetical protein
MLWMLVALAAAGCTEYKLEASADAFAADDTGVDDRADADGDDMAVPVDFDSAISGRVCDSLGDGWVVGAYVYTTFDSDGDGEHDSRVEDSTDIEGRFLLTGLPSGRDYVVHAVKGSFEQSFDVSLTSGTYEIPEDECSLEPPNIAVISGDYDHIEDIISSMGLDFTLYQGTYGSTEYLDFLRDPAAMAEFDIIFFNCGVSSDWYYMARDEVRNNIRTFVENGGSIYTSDWAYYFVENTFPAKMTFYGNDNTFGAATVGQSGSVLADVVDPTMQAIIGAPTADINFDLDMWAVLESVGPDVETLLSARVNVVDIWGTGTTLPNAPIAARFAIGEGRVIYTTFHNEHAATTLDMTDILEEIILSL